MGLKNSTLKHIPPLWAIAVAAALFLFMAFQVIVTGGSTIDAPVYGVVSQFISPGLTKIVTVITHMGGEPVLVSLCVVSCLIFLEAVRLAADGRKRRQPAVGLDA